MTNRNRALMVEIDRSVDERLGEEKLRGVFHIVVGSDGRAVDEEVTITRAGTRVHFEGRVIAGERWAASTLTFELKGNLLAGSGRDERGNQKDVVLRKTQ